MNPRPHRRYNPLNGSSVLVSPQRTERPWQGQVDTPEHAALPAHDPDCYLCPGNQRAGGVQNPRYTGPWAFDNDFPALLPDKEPDEQAEQAHTSHPLLRASAEPGRCRVVCYSERHDQSLATLSEGDFNQALHFLFQEFARLDADPQLGYVQMFENRGAMMGCSNPHPHAQIWATETLPDEAAREHEQQSRYLARHGTKLLLDYLAQELERQERVLVSNDHAAALVPYWATWPYELLILPRSPASGPAELDKAQVEGLAQCLQQGLQALNALFDTPMPYSLGFHARPSDGLEHPQWQFHAHVFPPLLRSATIRKHMVGFELLGMPQRDLTPELAARQLREALQHCRN